MRKIGDKIKIKSLKELQALNQIGVDVVDSMFEYADKEGIITKIIDKEDWYFADEPEYKIDIDDEFWTWYDVLFEII